MKLVVVVTDNVVKYINGILEEANANNSII